MSNPIKQKAAIIKEMFGEKTDLTNRLSYSNGVKNIINVKRSNLSIRLRVSNLDKIKVDDKDEEVVVEAQDRTIYMVARSTIHGFIQDTISTESLPSGVGFFEGDDDLPAGLAIKSLNKDQILSSLANELMGSPMQIIGISMKSYNSERKGESSNYSNSITHYNISSLRPKKYTDLNLGDYQNTKDFSTDILKIDFIKENFIAPISISDLLAFQVNANTVLDITFHLGARDSVPERFYRDITTGTQLLNDASWGVVDDRCACN